MDFDTYIYNSYINTILYIYLKNTTKESMSASIRKRCQFNPDPFFPDLLKPPDYDNTIVIL